MDIETNSHSYINYGINDLSNTPLWNLIQEKLNSSNLQWEDAIANEKQRKKNIRKSKIAWLKDSYLREQLFHSIDLFNKKNWNYDLDGTELFQYGIYSGGGYYDWHIDQRPEIKNLYGQSLVRKLSMTIWLNDPDEYEGGEFDIEVDGPYKDLRYESLKLPKGSIIVFPSNSWHRVRPVTSGERKSLVGWFSGPPLR
tara:strand:- start:20 stop:610 length:591 start_codon:yes stop_codon:yes gene_type:complete